jgi:hypothetical protein
MKIDLFKKLIKEAVAEAVREELSTILNEQQIKPKLNHLQEQNLSFTSNDVMTTRTNIREKMGNMFGFDEPSNNSTLKVDNNAENPYLAFLADSAANMTPQERSGLKNLG